MINLRESQLLHYGYGLTAAHTCLAMHDIGFTLIQLGEFGFEGKGVVVDIDRILYVRKSEFHRCSNI